MASGLEARLRSALSGRKDFDLSQFQFLSLEMVKVGTGDQWIPLRKKIYQVAAHFVEKRLHPEDVLVRCRGGFILIFANLEGYRAKERVRDISDALNLFFLGDQILKDLEIRSDTRTVRAEDLQQFISLTEAKSSDDPSAEPCRRDSNEVLEAEKGAGWKTLDHDGKLTPDGPRTEIKSRRKRQGGAWSEQGGKSSADAHWEAQDPSASRTVATVQSQPADASKTTPAGAGVLAEMKEAQAQEKIAPQHPPGKASDSATPASQKVFAEPVSETPGKAPAVHGAQPEQTPAAELGLVDAVFTEDASHWDDVVFKPCWDAKNAIIANTFCLPRKISNGRAYYGRDTLQGAGTSDLNRYLDHTVAVAAQRGFQNRYAEGQTCAIAIPVHYDTISVVSDRVSYFSILQSVPQHLRRYFFLRVDDIPDGAPISQMQELFRSMACFGSNILANVQFGRSDFTDFEGCGIGLFGSETPSRMNEAEILDEDIASLANQCRAAQEMSAQTYLTQVASFATLSAAVTAGVRYHAGLAIGDESALPVPVTPCTFNDLYERSQKFQSSHASPVTKTG